MTRLHVRVKHAVVLVAARRALATNRHARVRVDRLRVPRRVAWPSRCAERSPRSTRRPCHPVATVTSAGTKAKFRIDDSVHARRAAASTRRSHPRDSRARSPCDVAAPIHLLRPERCLDALRALEVRDECRANLLEQRLELGVLGARDQRLVERIERRPGGTRPRCRCMPCRTPHRSEPCRLAMFASAPALSCRLTSLSSGVTPSFVASATACLFTPAWSVTIVCTEILHRLRGPFCFASCAGGAVDRRWR